MFFVLLLVLKIQNQTMSTAHQTMLEKVNIIAKLRMRLQISLYRLIFMSKTKYLLYIL